MTDNEHSAPGQRLRIVLAMEPAAREASALDIVRCLSGERLPDLLGLIVEDAHLLEHAGSRLAREVVLSGLDRPLDAVALTRQIRAQAEAARRRLESAMHRLGLTGRFEVTRGELMAELERSAEGAETMVLAEALESAELRRRWLAAAQNLLLSSTRSLLFARAGWTTGHSVLTVIDDPESAEALLAIAAQLAERSRSRLGIYLTAATAEEREALVRRVEALRRPLHDLVLTGTNKPGGLAAAAYQAQARIIVVPWREDGEEKARVNEILERTRSALLLVR